MKISVLTVGRKHEAWVEQGIERFLERLRPPFDARVDILPPSKLSGLRAIEEESGTILRRIKTSDFVILLDERGKNFSSNEFSEIIQNHTNTQVVIIIGGAYGVGEAVLTRANLTWSLSNLVFPHQLVRLILAEQLYRAQEIAKGSGYHHP